MEVEEAIEILKRDYDENIHEEGYKEEFGDVLEAEKMAISALEKQVAKKPKNTELTTYSGGTQVLHAYCPICEQPIKIYNGHQKNKVFRRDEDVFCSYCGQKLNWSDE